MGILEGNLTIERIISFILNFNLDCKGVRVHMIDNTPKNKKSINPKGSLSICLSNNQEKHYN
jgi:hypothetical protein